MTLLLEMTESLEQQVHQAAKSHQRTSEQFVIELLSQIFERKMPVFDAPTLVLDSAPDAIDESITEVVARIKAVPPNLAIITPAEGSLADALRDGPTDPGFDLQKWEQEWAIAEEELKQMNQLDDIVEGRP